MATTTDEPTHELHLATSVQELVDAATAATRSLTADEAIERLDDGDVVFVDVRDGPERDASIPGAVHASRGMLEFLVDPVSPFHLPAFTPDRGYVLYCSMGARSALAAHRLQELGLEDVAHLSGGFDAWTDAGGPVEGV